MVLKPGGRRRGDLTTEYEIGLGLDRIQFGDAVRIGPVLRPTGSDGLREAVVGVTRLAEPSEADGLKELVRSGGPHAFGSAGVAQLDECIGPSTEPAVGYAQGTPADWVAGSQIDCPRASGRAASESRIAGGPIQARPGQLHAGTRLIGAGFNDILQQASPQVRDDPAESRAERMPQQRVFPRWRSSRATRAVPSDLRVEAEVGEHRGDRA